MAAGQNKPQTRKSTEMSDLPHFNATDFAPAEILASPNPVGYWGDVRLKPGVDAADVEPTMRAVMDAAREEPGCEIYAIFHGPDEAGSYRISEKWATGEDLRAHIENPDLYPYIERFAETLDFSNAQWVHAVV